MDIRHPIPTNGGDWVSKFGDLWTKQVGELKASFGAAIEQVLMPSVDPTDVPIVFVKKESVVAVLKALKEQPGFEYGFLADITATDEGEDPRFHIVYNLFSHQHKCRFRVKVKVRENEETPTAVGLWKGANWAEREVFDMFGVRFSGHPDMRRILMDQRWKGHPLRKDYPLRGYQIFMEPESVDPTLLE